jgi:hypothetical protein
MASLTGYGNTYNGVPVTPPGAVQASIPGSDPGGNVVVIDGTPVRVVVLAFSAAIGLVALKWAGFKFNVGVSAS